MRRVNGTHLSVEELAAVGHIALRHALIDQLVTWSLWSLIDRTDDNIGANITERWSFAAKAAKFAKLIPLRIAEGDYRDLLAAWLAKTTRANSDRNTILHAALLRFPDEPDRLSHMRIVPGETEAIIEINSFDAAALVRFARSLDRIAEEGAELFAALEKGEAPLV
jgi:hypothetical protein